MRVSINASNESQVRQNAIALICQASVVKRTRRRGTTDDASLGDSQPSQIQANAQENLACILTALAD